MLITDSIYESIVKKNLDKYRVDNNGKLSNEEINTRVDAMKREYDMMKPVYRYQHLVKKMLDVLHFLEYNDSFFLKKEKERLNKSIANLKLNQSLDVATSSSIPVPSPIPMKNDEELRLKILNLVEERNLLEDVDRTLFNYVSYKEIVKTMCALLPFAVGYIKNDNSDEFGKKSLLIHTSLALLNLYFEDIYKDIIEIVSADYSQMSDKDIDDVVNDRCNKLRSKYGNGNRDDLISTVMNKYFTDTEMYKKSVVVPPRLIFAKIRSRFPQDNKCKMFVALRNLSSHGDYNVVNKNDIIKLVKAGNVVCSYDDLLAFIKNNIYNDDDRYKYFLHFINRLNCENNDDVLSIHEQWSFLIKLSSFIIIQYNTQHYFNDLRSANGEYVVNNLNIDKVFRVVHNSPKKNDISGYDILEYVKNAIGHGNVDIDGDRVVFYNKLTDTMITANILDYLEFIFQPELVSSLSFTNSYKMYFDLCNICGVSVDKSDKHAADMDVSNFLNYFYRNRNNNEVAMWEMNIPFVVDSEFDSVKRGK